MSYGVAMSEWGPVEPPCWYSGDHHWRGGSCSVCGERLRCGCGRFVRVEQMDAHFDSDCPMVARVVSDQGGTE